jgi:SOS-response transcriptional repressor LexA
MNLTPRQRDLLLFIQRYQDANGCSPSFDECCGGVSLASKSGVSRLLEGLEARGLITHIKYRARAITILQRIHDPEARTVSDDGRQAFKALICELAREPLTFDLQRKAQRLLEAYP